MGSGNSEWPGQELTRATADGAGGWSFGAVPVQADEGQTSTIVAEDAYFEGGSVTLDWNDGVNQDRQKSISAPQIHKDLKFLDGGDAVTGEFWHTTAAEHATLTGKITEISRLGLEFVSAAAIPTAAEVQANFGPNVWGVALGNLNEPYFVYGDADGLSGWGTGMGALL
jgi:hypothetical protein